MTRRRILAAGWILFLLYAYPGYLGADGADQLADARSGVFMDWHPAMMTEVWRLVGYVLSGPPAMLLLQSGLLLFGCNALFRRVLSERGAAIAAACVLVSPPVLATQAIVCAQAQLAGFGVAGAACLASERARIRYAGLGLLAIAAGMGTGAPVAVLPLVLGLFRLRDGAPPLRRFASALAAWLAISAFAIGASWLMVDHWTERDDVAGALADLAALRHATRDPSIIVPPAPEAPEETAAVFAAHEAAVRAHPSAYRQLRQTAIEGELGLGLRVADWPAWSPVYTDILPIPETPTANVALHLRARHSSMQDALITPVQKIEHSVLFRPWLYAILALALAGVAIGSRDRDALLWLVSGIGFEITVLLDARVPQYRDSHWLIVATLVAAILSTARRARVARQNFATNASAR